MQDSFVDVLDIAITVPVPISGWNDWRYHMDEKSPRVQPTRHRSVLTPARRHRGLDDQNWVDRRDGGDAGWCCCCGPFLLHADRNWRRCVANVAMVGSLAAGTRARAAGLASLLERSIEADAVTVAMAGRIYGHGWVKTLHSMAKQEFLMEDELAQDGDGPRELIIVDSPEEPPPGVRGDRVSRQWHKPLNRHNPRIQTLAEFQLRTLGQDFFLTNAHSRQSRNHLGTSGPQTANDSSPAGPCPTAVSPSTRSPSA